MKSYSQRGFVLVTVLGIAVILFLFVTAYTSFTAADHQNSRNYFQRVKRGYLQQAALELAVATVRGLPLGDEGLAGGLSLEHEVGKGGGYCQATITPLTAEQGSRYLPPGVIYSSRMVLAQARGALDKAALTKQLIALTAVLDPTTSPMAVYYIPVPGSGK